MKFIDSIRSCYLQYLNFSGVASRSEYWYFALYSFIAIGSAYFGFYLDDHFEPSLIGLFTQTLGLAIYLSTIIPTVSVTTRRLHDIGLSGWVQLIVIIPMVGGVLLLALMCKAHKDSKYSGYIFTLQASKRKNYLYSALIFLVSIFSAVVILNALDVYDDYQISKKIGKLSPYNKQVLLYQLKIYEGEIGKADTQITLLQSLDDAQKLEGNKGRVQLSKHISGLLETNEFWWVQDNKLTIIIGNYQSELVGSVVFSMQKGNCSESSGDITYLNLYLGDHPLASNTRMAYTSDLPFNYRDKFGDELICGLIIGASGK